MQFTLDQLLKKGIHVMFNNYVWNLYLQSGGKKRVAFFKDNLSKQLSSSYADEIAKMHKVYCVTTAVVENTKEQLSVLYDDLNEMSLTSFNIEENSSEESDCFEEIENIFAELLEEGFDGLLTEKDLFEGRL